MATIFSETLTRLRREAGFATAYRFFHDNGGDKLVRAWLRTMAGDELYGEILEPMLAEHPEKLRLSPSQKVLGDAVAGRKFYLTPDHLRLVTATAADYLCFQLLSNDAGPWTPERLAEAAGLKKPEAAATLRKFFAARLLRKAGAAYKCPLAGAMAEMPPRAAAPEVFELLRRRQQELVMSGLQAYHRRGIFRADADALRDFYPLMAVNISSSHVYAVKEKTPKSALFAVEGRVIKIRDF